MEITLTQLAQRLGATLEVDDQAHSGVLTSVAAAEAAGPQDISFINDERHRAIAARCRAGAVLVEEKIKALTCPQLIVPSVDRALIDVLHLFAPTLKPVPIGVHPGAHVADTAQLGQGVCIDPSVVIEDNVVIGDHVVIRSGCKIGQNTVIGSHARLDWNVVVYHGCRIGSHVIIQANTTIGAVGFGYAYLDDAHTLVPHNGGVIIEDCVEIGANCCIDRAKFDNTIVGAGTKMDNLVQIGHNAIIGKCCLLAAQVGIAGSSKLGDGVVLAGQVGLADNLVIGDGVKVGAQSGVMNDVPAGQTVVWSPALEQNQAKRVVGEILRLPKTAKRMRQLMKRLDELEASENDKG